MTPGKLSRPPILKILPEGLNAAQALQDRHFVPFFQPLVTLRTGQLAGFEVLARWQHPIKGHIPPLTFIPVAEQDGWIGELTAQIFQKAFAAGSSLPDPLFLAVNISPLQLLDTDLPGQVFALATEAKFPLSRIVVEITESALIENLETAASIVAEFKQMGCRLSLDDFGTGYSSLCHLQALPFDELKVDRSFVSSMTEKRESRKIVSAVIGLGQSIGLTTVAEGIETQEQAEMMLWLGCDLGQGYFYGLPIPACALDAYVSTVREKLVVRQDSAWRKISFTNLESSPTRRLAQLQAVYDGAPVGLALIDQNFCYVNLNQKLADMNGASIEAHLGSSVESMIPLLFHQVEPHIRRALRGEAVPDIEVRIQSKDETRLGSYHPVTDEAGEILGVSVAVFDITKWKHAEQSLKINEAHNRSMVELNPQVLWIMDPQGRNLDVSPRWDKTTGLLKSTATDHLWLKSVHPDDIGPTVRAISDARSTGSAIDVQYRDADARGGWQWKRSRGAPRFDADGNIVCWYGSVEELDAPSLRRNSSARASCSLVNVGSRVDVTHPSLASWDADDRSRALADLDILDTPPEAIFDDLVALSAEICGTPMSLITLIDGERQWFKAAAGLTASQTSIDVSFCIHAIAQPGIFVVEDANKDERFRHNPLVVGETHVRFYAGIPIVAGDGVAIGTLCVVDIVPRILTPGQTKALTILSHQVQAHFNLRAERKKLLKEVRDKRELAARMEGSSHFPAEVNHKIDKVLAQVEGQRHVCA